ncbi:HEAT repeat domain-containing protein [Kineosporia sp. J2-2]|uniref:HEAT repeat domain-containing protein n=1 Tax=Kineosporia corallincola TaxID=2835133 RepID=A0ABS5TKV8_9ACTN|nr:hypothetical protein [Kineosporia corallincola]MBT0771711.1 HEAT repeat domain-containing protein [Kineosporia corallincola]
MNPREAVFRALELGTSTSPDAPAELRGLIAVTGPGRQELRRAAIAALSCTAGAQATDDFAALLGDRTRAVREEASWALYDVGDDRAWETVLEFLAGEVRERGPRRGPLPPAMPISYLAVHAPAGSDRARRLTGFLRGQWLRLSAAERQWLAGHAPQVAPGGPAEHLVRLPGREDLTRAVG